MSFIEDYTTGNDLGTDVTCDNTWQLVMASTSSKANYLLISFAYKTPSSDRRASVSIGLGTSGNETVIVESLTTARSTQSTREVETYWVPVNVPAGSRVSVRGTDISLGLDLIRTTISAYKLGEHLYTNVDLLGNASISAASAHTKGSWGQITAACARNYDSVAVSTLAPSIGMTNSKWLVDIGTGAAASEVVVLANLAGYTPASTDIPRPTSFQFYPITLRQGVRVAARTQGTVTEAFSVYVYGLRREELAVPARQAPIPMEPALARDGLTLLHNPMPNISTTYGTELTVANQDVWVEAVASTSGTVQYITICIREHHTTGAMVTGIVDIGVGVAGSEVVVAQELWAQKNNWDAGGTAVEYRLPLTIAAGSRVCVRYKTLTGTRANSCYYSMNLYGGATTLSSYNRCDMLGRGTTVATTANTSSGWVQLKGYTEAEYKEIMVGYITPNSTTDYAQIQVDVAVGAAASEVPIVENMSTTASYQDYMVSEWASPRLPIAIPVGSRVSARIRNTDDGANSTMTICVWGFR